MVQEGALCTAPGRNGPRSVSVRTRRPPHLPEGRCQGPARTPKERGSARRQRRLGAPPACWRGQACPPGPDTAERGTEAPPAGAGLLPTAAVVPLRSPSPRSNHSVWFQRRAGMPSSKRMPGSKAMPWQDTSPPQYLPYDLRTGCYETPGERTPPQKEKSPHQHFPLQRGRKQSLQQSTLRTPLAQCNQTGAGLALPVASTFHSSSWRKNCKHTPKPLPPMITIRDFSNCKNNCN